MFFAIGQQDQLQTFTDDLLKYLNNESRYVITHEIANISLKPHFHVVAEMTTDQYTKYADAILRKKYKLKGNKKEYGKVNKINDVNKAISYILKDLAEKDAAERMLGMRSNIDEIELQQFLENSYKKSDDKCHIETCIEKIAPMKLQYEYSDDDLLWYKIKILEYYQEKKIDVGYKKIDRIFEMYINRQHHLPATVLYTILRQNFKNRI